MRINILVLVAIIVLAVMPAGVQAQSDEGLVAEWHFDEGSGNVVKDSSGNGNNGVIHGATWVEGKFYSTFDFNVDYSIEILVSPELSGGKTLNIEWWIKLCGSYNEVCEKLEK